jgi:DNA-binding NtrC family response regulator
MVPPASRSTGERAAEPAPDSFGELVGRTSAMRSIFARCASLAQASDGILLSGEFGTGKHLLARCLHAAGPHASRPFVVLDCATVSAGALPDELFGKSAGSQSARPGALELAQGGTLLLREPSALPMPLQEQLGRALIERSFLRQGPRGPEQVSLSARVIAATRARAADDVERGRLARALHGALSAHTIALPALRDRRDDIPLLARALLERMDDAQGTSLTPEAAAAFALHDWPGNVRELRNVIERALYGVRRGGEGARRLAATLFSGAAELNIPAADPQAFEPDLSYREQRARFEDAFEKRYVAWLLDRHDGNVSAAARAADMDRKYLYKLAKKHALKASG